MERLGIRAGDAAEPCGISETFRGLVFLFTVGWPSSGQYGAVEGYRNVTPVDGPGESLPSESYTG